MILKDKYNVFLMKLFNFDVSCIIVCLIMLFPIIWSIPNSFVKLGVDLTNICLFIYLSLFNISMLLYMPLLAWYIIQKDKRSKSID